jgi:antitoxin (DNA-binding transcriptional repressor) of toxin-antitoxin stability system
MRRVGIKALKNDLSKYIRAAEAGETLLVTDRNRVVAEISPPRGEEGGTEAERQWAQMIRQGLVTPAKIPPEARMPPRRVANIGFDELMADLDESRSDD